MSKELSPVEFMERHHDGVFEFYYEMMKESAFEFYRWGLRTDSAEAIELYGEMLKLYSKYDSKFKRAD
ncbi:MAG: hypothetical protein OXI34_15240 [Chloroflexota bacterium]|nr:hypothetical protein [Chloroflexota bacterium]MDE2855857.1 hypothetical protein [Chloroflexota bacterium]MDE2946093.1 hypothetical protein [Chloroflexota bacterium]